jgi:hypothetical protein
MEGLILCVMQCDVKEINQMSARCTHVIHNLTRLEALKRIFHSFRYNLQGTPSLKKVRYKVNSPKESQRRLVRHHGENSMKSIEIME